MIKRLELLKLRFLFELQYKQILLLCHSDIPRALNLSQQVEYHNGHCLTEVETGYRFTLLLTGYHLINFSVCVCARKPLSLKYLIDRKLLHGSKC